MSLLGLQSEPASVDPKSPKSPKKMPESPKKAPATPKAKIGRRNVEVTASDGIDIAKVVESKPFKELIDSLANKKSFEALQIKILSVVEQLRIENCDYIVVRPDLPVCETMKRKSDKVATLAIDTVVKVLEIHEEDEDGRVRARIESPAGWISTSHHKGTIYAKPREAASDITYIECMVDAKIDGKLAPATLFVRGSAVAALVVLHVDAEKRSYALLVKQDGVPDSLAAIGDIPAGTFDSDGSFTGALAKEILEKVGIEIKQSDLVDVTEATYKDGTPSIFPSCGAKIFEKVLCAAGAYYSGGSEKVGRKPWRSKRWRFKVIP
jgi:8-oxo-dGTP pyrophosphatase MutT (NUDIX family)